MIDRSHNGISPHNFEFSPKHEPGIAAHINSSFEPIDCSTELFTDIILKKLLNAIYNFTKLVR